MEVLIESGRADTPPLTYIHKEKLQTISCSSLFPYLKKYLEPVLQSRNFLRRLRLWKSEVLEPTSAKLFVSGSMQKKGLKAAPTPAPDTN